jgi:hypothetical protein
LRELDKARSHNDYYYFLLKLAKQESINKFPLVLHTSELADEKLLTTLEGIGIDTDTQFSNGMDG